MAACRRAQTGIPLEAVVRPEHDNGATGKLPEVGKETFAGKCTPPLETVKQDRRRRPLGKANRGIDRLAKRGQWPVPKGFMPANRQPSPE